MQKNRIEELNEKINNFAKVRNWEQYHSPKNLAMALAAESGELLEIFQWLKEKDSFNLGKSKLKAVKNEIGDIQIYLLRIAFQLGIDPILAAEEKLKINEEKYPVDKAWNNARKYTEFEK